jgi:hypothetical protein
MSRGSRAVAIRQLLVLVSCAVAQSALLKSVYYDQRGDELRFEVLVDKWWAEQVQEEVIIPAGAMISSRMPDLVSNVTIPSNISITLTNFDRSARLGGDLVCACGHYTVWYVSKRSPL